MKIGVISDTHIPRAAARIPEEVYTLFAGAELILHAGDLEELAVLKQLQKIAPVEAVCGNMDSLNVTNRLPAKKIVTVGDVKIGLIHGSGAPGNLKKRISRTFVNENVRVIVYGHSHFPANQLEGEVLFFNPGSPTDRVFASVNSVGILKIEGKNIRGEIIRL